MWDGFTIDKDGVKQDFRILEYSGFLFYAQHKIDAGYKVYFCVRDYDELLGIETWIAQEYTKGWFRNESEVLKDLELYEGLINPDGLNEFWVKERMEENERQIHSSIDS